jgi:amino acid transporter
MSEPLPVKAAKNSFGRAMLAVAWSFLGIRKNSGFAEDSARVSPLHVMLVGLLSGLIFVIGLILVVNWVVAK